MSDLDNAIHWTTSQSARALKCSPARVIQLASAGQLPHIKTPLGRLFDAAAVRQLALEREQNNSKHQVAEVV